MNGPCIDCPDRHVGCHSECLKYLEYKRELDDLNKKIRKYKDTESCLNSLEMKRSSRRRRKR